jgi:acyl-coenzyme A synthetase/AMP-(fatty) acid ligase
MPPTYVTDAHLEHLREHGYVVIPDVIATDKLPRLREGKSLRLAFRIALRNAPLANLCA